MSRFIIEEIVSQDKYGIVYRAFDHECDTSVALRRFFPFGLDGGGLDAEEVISFRLASGRLSALRHPSFRSIFSGDVDPIDGIPFISAEWIDGDSLEKLRHGCKVEASIAIDILQEALEVSLLLSSVLGDEAVWVDTAIDAILIGSEDSERNMVFWLSPYKWLGGEFSSRKVSSLIELTENLLGWRGKLIGNQAGFGLGGWITQLRANPNTSPSQALAALQAVIIEKNRPRPELRVERNPVVLQSQKQTRPAFPYSTLAYTFLLLIGLALLSFFAISFLKKNAQAKQASAPIVQVHSNGIPIFSPHETEMILAIKGQKNAEVQGILRGLQYSKSGKSLYFNFSEPYDGAQIRVVAHRSSYRGNFDAQAYRYLIGKNVRFTGVIFREINRKFPYVKISSEEHMNPIQ
jgi:hypothetical protein